MPSCGSGGDASPVTHSTVVENGFRKVGSKTAAYAHWRVTCQNADQDFDPRLWWLPKSMIAFREHGTARRAPARPSTRSSPASRSVHSRAAPP